jgi:hypothetical protein
MDAAEKVRHEMEVFRRMLPGLLEEHSGQWVIFFDGKLIDFFADEASAYKAAMQQFGPGTGFVVAQVAPEQPQPTSFTLLFGVVR